MLFCGVSIRVRRYLLDGLVVLVYFRVREEDVDVSETADQNGKGPEDGGTRRRV